ncbi:NAD+ synthase [soil metagenome]
MQSSLRLALAQINPTVGDVEGNARMISGAIGSARDQGAELVVFPELCLSGYPAEDLYLKRHFLEANAIAIESLANDAVGITAVIGFAEPLRNEMIRRADTPYKRAAANSLAVVRDGTVDAIYRKINLPNYAVCDERRYFEPGTRPMTIEVGGVKVGLTICEDIWEPGPPASNEAESGAELILNPSGSPYARGKAIEREQMIATRAREYGATFAFCNLVGGQDELIFDGDSFVVGPEGNTLARASRFRDELLICDLPSGGGPVATPMDDLAEVYEALCTGLRDYVAKNGFLHVLIGVSGGIDSALVALLAADALGAENVTCVVMPSPHSSGETQDDARSIVANLGSELSEIEIADPMKAYDKALDGLIGEVPGVAAENVQARIRGNMLMAISNARGWLVLTTGNKSEMSVGYATLYGDMAGGFAVIKDVPKTLVYELVRYRNALSPTPPIPPAVIERPPSAELRPDQRDDDSLPPYEVLDPILEAYVERDLSRDQIIELGADASIVEEVVAMVDRSEYKRRQAPPGVRITPRAFGRDRRLPITNRFGG